MNKKTHKVIRKILGMALIPLLGFWDRKATEIKKFPQKFTQGSPQILRMVQQEREKWITLIRVTFLYRIGEDEQPLEQSRCPVSTEIHVRVISESSLRYMCESDESCQPFFSLFLVYFSLSMSYTSFFFFTLYV